MTPGDNKKQNRKKNLSEKMDDVLVFGSITLLFLLIFVSLWDDYIFYKVNYKDRINITATASKKITDQDIDRVIQLLDMRQEKYNELLGSSASTTIIAK